MWCELVKDVVATANSGGGIIVFRVSNDGSSSGVDPKPILPIDVPDIANKLRRYTSHEFADFEILAVKRSGAQFAAFLRSGAAIVFTKPATYEFDPCPYRKCHPVGERRRIRWMLTPDVGGLRLNHLNRIKKARPKPRHPHEKSAITAAQSKTRWCLPQSDG
jgi:hypothetical protein